MAGQLSKIKRQLRSVNSTKKLTNAMQLVATAKMQKQRSAMVFNNAYSETYYEFLLAALSAPVPKEGENNPYLLTNNSNNPLHIIITSNSGLCGSYNMDLLKYVQENISKDEAIFAIGTYGIKWLMANDYMVIKQFTELDDLKPKLINRLIDNALALYRAGEISSIDIIYTQYINSLKFLPSTFHLLPVKRIEGLEDSDILLEPSRDDVLNFLIPKYVSATIYAAFLQAKTSEQVARRNAMDSANKNADDLIEDLQLKFNQARQGSITQEMTEIISGTLK